jgi:ADP-heptose:LPS heptosyltransferase
MIVDEKFKKEQKKLNMEMIKIKIKERVEHIEKEILNDIQEMGGHDPRVQKQKYNTIQDVKNDYPDMVISKVTKEGVMKINGCDSHLIKGSSIVVGSSVYYSTALDRKTLNRNLIKNTKVKFKDVFNRYNGEELNNKTLFIWRMGGIGDIMFSQPIVYYLKSKYPTCKIIYSTAPGNIPLFSCWDKSLIDKAIKIPFLYEDLKKSHYHLSFEGSIERCKEANYTNCYDIFKKIAGVEFDVKDYLPKLYADRNLVKKYKKLFPQENLILIQMKSSSKIRTMGSKKWAEIVRNLKSKGYEIAFIDSSYNSSICEIFNNEYNFDVKNFATYSKTLKDGIALASLAKGMISIDSSFTHLAPALGIPTVGIFGPFEGKNRMSYYKYSDWVDSVGYSECGKYPCYFHGDQLHECPQYIKNLPPGCITTIDTELVVDKLIKKIEEKNGKQNE